MALAAVCLGCGQQDSRRQIDIWHQMRPEDAKVLAARIAEYERVHPEVKVEALYKETEELRSGLVSATLADSGPEILYGPSDAAGLCNAMGALADMSPWFSAEDLAAFDPRTLIRVPARDLPETEPAKKDALIFIGDRFGNHLALVYNRKFVKEPPQTTDDLLRLAKENTVDENGDGNVDRYGLVWNYTEPFFVIPFLTGYGAWVFDEKAEAQGKWIPALDTPESIAAYRFVAALRNEYGVLPRSADYEAAQALFKGGKAAMLIDGDWSWEDYLNDKSGELDAAVAVLPMVSATGQPMKPMVSPKGYSLTTFAKGQAADDAVDVIKFLTNEATQRAYLKKHILPSQLALRDDPAAKSDPIIAVSLAQAERGRVMPIALEMRAVFDAMKPPYQLLMANQMDAAEAAQKMQRDALKRIETVNRRLEPDWTAPLVSSGMLAALAALLWTQRRSFVAFWSDLRANRLAYVLALPSMIVIFITVVYPLVYNIVLSFSNMTLDNLRTWQVVGLQNYASLLRGDESSQFWHILVKTLFWTAVNVFFHVTLGVMLAVALNGPLRGKSIFRVLLVIPWAVPAYITALTWRGMFDEQFGAVNQMIRALSWVNQFLPEILQIGPVNWLGEAGPAFAACIIANVWLGFPFMMVIALGGLQGIPAELYEAARIDRASRWQQFKNITLPMLKPVLLPAITLGTVWTFNNLNIVWLVSNGGEPADQTHILVSYVYKAVFNLYQYGYGAALSMVIFAMLLAFSLVFLQKTRATEGVTA